MVQWNDTVEAHVNNDIWSQTEGFGSLYADLNTGEMGAIVNDVLVPSDTLQSIENINYFTYHDVNLTGDDDNNRLSSGSGDDTIYGGAGDDTLINGSGNDFVYGQDGDDIFYNWSGTDYYDGGQGNDTIISDFSSKEIEGIVDPQSLNFILI